MANKKQIIINILDILKRYTDEDHRLSQREIAEILKNEYNMTVERKSIKRNLSNLLEFGYPIEYSESIRMVPNKVTGELEESYMLSDFYLERDFTDAELRLLIDSLLFSKHIPYSQCKELIEKLEGLSNKYFESKIKHIRTLPENKPANPQLFYTIGILDEAISKEKQVKFHYSFYETDKKLHPRKDSNGKPREYIINPYQIVATDGRYYLICNNDRYDNLSNYRVDRITDIELLDTPAKPMRDVKGAENGFDLSKHMAEHIYMFTGDTVRAEFIAEKYIISDIMDFFGNDVVFSNETEDKVTVTVTVNEQDMRFWALLYALQIKVISPPSLVESVKNDIMKAAEKYKG
ncbi:MAG: WYL domain-containing protein [Eubacterium sp.]|nr:WYL domain-containing protein [Eubacterium sp.]